MSEFVRVQGQLKKIELSELDIKEIMQLRGYEKPTYFKSWLDFALEELCEEFVKIGDDFYKIKSFRHIHPNDTFCEIDSNLNFDAQYYNGSSSWTQLVEEKLQKKDLT